jgi:anti-sigma-K factor RskA
MSDDATINPADGNLTAAEYVLGVLDAEQRREVERRLPHEPALANEVAFWEERLGGLADAVTPVAPPAHAWSRIEAELGAPSGGRPPSVWHVGLVPSARQPLMATLAGSAGQPNFVASVTASGNSLVVVPAALLTNDPRSIELWLIPRGANQRPHSLGLVQPGQPIRLTIPPDLVGRIGPDATLAVSLEPPGGAPTGQPTGPVIASGKLTRL